MSRFCSNTDVYLVQAGDAAAHPLSTTTATSRKAVESTVTAHTHTPSSSSSPKTSAPAPEATDVSAPAAADPSDTTAVEGEGSEAASGAYDPVTGEINWDCPCLGGMAHGPCGPQFREAFSCFIYSEQEPKGIDCVEKFKGMQDCFREHPEVYAEGECLMLLAAETWVLTCFELPEIMDDDEEEDGVPAESTLIKEETTLSAESSPSDLASSSPAPASA